ncbi:MAG: hypothetical protein GTN62_07380 [Gemmatimonadales bacterium]|nr:hypothetical protein [Gemmatimonadales bacterium]NIN11322.1 hypothetical protein [Gemmatimonadales bacterium]NIN49921.1 hypothetical protein [Gemmatimonadales bacterium]NIP07385.1 hypothetical protein [Gemmatimonadales bacterium]NIR03080.1 hypothetical protein [Gemmatimonadales bacterium]
MSDTLDRLKTAHADRYTIERELGHGRMALVFLAQDRKLGRPVALKVPRPGLAAALGAAAPAQGYARNRAPRSALPVHHSP